MGSDLAPAPHNKRLKAWAPRQRRLSVRSQLNFQRHSCRALRCNLLRTLLQEDFRGFAVRLADSPLFQFFCALAELDRVVVPSKRTLQRYAQWIEQPALDTLLRELLSRAHTQPRVLRLQEAIDLDACFFDTTCVEANIHYPVDWVLLRDATRTLMKAIALIRDQGLRHRMEPPAVFITRMNRLCIAMSHTPKKADGQRHRKKVLRKMDRLVGTVRTHARRYRQLLYKVGADRVDPSASRAGAAAPRRSAPTAARGPGASAPAYPARRRSNSRSSVLANGFSSG